MATDRVSTRAATEQAELPVHIDHPVEPEPPAEPESRVESETTLNPEPRGEPNLTIEPKAYNHTDSQKLKRRYELQKALHIIFSSAATNQPGEDETIEDYRKRLHTQLPIDMYKRLQRSTKGTLPFHFNNMLLYPDFAWLFASMRAALPPDLPEHYILYNVIIHIFGGLSKCSNNHVGGGDSVEGILMRCTEFMHSLRDAMTPEKDISNQGERMYLFYTPL